MSTPNTKTYTINGKSYTQSLLVIGQIPRLMELVVNLPIHSNPLVMINTWGPKLPQVLACVLVPQGQTPDQVDCEALARELTWVVDIDTALVMVTDFLSLTGPTSLFRRLTDLLPAAPAPVIEAEPAPAEPGPSLAPAAEEAAPAVEMMTTTGSATSAPSLPAATPSGDGRSAGE
jgi:hypothetical protein